MSTVIVLTPIIIASWPAITAAVTAAAVTLCFEVTESQAGAEEGVSERVKARSTAEVDLATEEVSEALATNQSIVVRQGTVELTVRRDERGACKVCATGLGHSKTELETMAQAFADQMTQCFVYNRVMTELRAKGLNVVNEEQLDDKSIRIHVRQWEG